MKLSRKHAWLAVAALAALAGVAWAAVRLTRGPAVDAFTVSRGALVQTVVASGRVESPRRVEIGSQVAGTVASIPGRGGAGRQGGPAPHRPRG